MKNFKWFLIIVVLIATFTSCERVAPNYQGVLMENFGKNGKSDFSLQKGRVWTFSPGVELFQVPLYEQRGEFKERVLQLKAADNTEFTSQPMYSYKIIENRAVDVVFDNKQIGSNNGDEFMDALEDNILETKIYDIMKEESRKYSTETLMQTSILADGTTTNGSLIFEKNVQDVVSKEFEKRGLELISFSCQLTFTESVTKKIDARNEVNTNISVIDQQIEEQKKKNELAKLQAEYNIIISKGLTNEILTQQFIEAWRVTKQPLYGEIPLLKNLK